MKFEIIAAAMKYHWTMFRDKETYDFYATKYVDILKHFDCDIVDAI